jgi:exopolysaccharide production protein ExoZ
MGRLNSLQVLRFLAAFGVVEAHTLGNQAGAMGVDVFFVLSGFIITKTARAHPEGFLLNRLTRVLPTYYVFALPALAWASLGAPLDWRRMVSTLVLWPGFDVFAIPYVPVAWTLCFEALFYICVWLVLRGARPSWFLAAFAVADVVAGFTHLAILDFLGSPLILEFLFGVGLALVGWRSRWAGGAALAVAGAVVAFFVATGPHGLAHMVGGPGALVRTVEWGVPSALIVFGALQFDALVKGPMWGALVFMGDASYSLYLSHVPIVDCLRHGHVPSAFSLLAAVACGAAFYAFVEKPLIRLVRGVAMRKPVRQIEQDHALATGPLPDC